MDNTISIPFCSFQPSPEERNGALISALSDILWKLGRQQKATVALPPSSHSQHSTRLPSRSYTPDHLTERVYWQYTDSILTEYWQNTSILDNAYIATCILHKKRVMSVVISLKEKGTWKAKQSPKGTVQCTVWHPMYMQMGKGRVHVYTCIGKGVPFTTYHEINNCDLTIVNFNPQVILYNFTDYSLLKDFITSHIFSVSYCLEPSRFKICVIYTTYNRGHIQYMVNGSLCSEILQI